MVDALRSSTMLEQTPTLVPTCTTESSGTQLRTSLEIVDIVVLVLYFLFVLAVGFWSMCRTKRSTVDGYFLAGKNMVWWPVGASLFASNVGSGHFVGLAGSGAASGIAVTAYEWNGMFIVLLLAWLFLPIYVASGVTTMPEYLQRRFGGSRIQILLAILYLFIYIFTKISVDIYAGAMFIQQALQWDLYLAIVGLLAITAVYTVAGGLAAVIYTDALQTVFMLLGGLILMGFSLRGLMMSVMIAALMSSLTSIFNSSATIFTMDVWRFCRPRSSEWELMIVGRVFVLVLVVISVLWIPLVKASQGGQLFIYIQSISSYLQPPVAIVFIAGCFWKRTNERGAFCALVLGLLAGCVRMVLDMVYPAPQCHEEDSRPAIVRNVHYLYFSVIVSAFTLVVVLVISLTSEPPSQQQMSRLTWFTRFDKPPQGHVENESVGEDGEADVPGDGKDGGSGGTVSESSWNQKLKAAFMWLCGLQRQDGHKAPCPPKPAVNIAVLEEDPLMKHMVNANLLVCMSLAVFLWAYFA
ncbi:sodium/myo-inositol cotransporter 2 isoform X2 [Polypterus senegalus]|uniref:sodium/myo-inositol cotransporter 2 isoform X2 n=1 Tax=Polypterus senegalus TaxID=55291 RepID=UPI0019635EEC|nr:sodium/myo-inositol cotransporter 2 isoform X2 [Polypterus senegalus]